MGAVLSFSTFGAEVALIVAHFKPIRRFSSESDRPRANLW
jgi:hypothetical protein